MTSYFSRRAPISAAKRRLPSSSGEVFPASPAGNRRYILAAEEVRDMAEIKINGQDAGKFLFRPYEIDITALVKEGENEAEAVLTPSPANRYGKPVPSYIGGLTVRVTEKRG